LKIRILSGWSNPGGSTIHHINLTNLLNDNGYDCTFYGPHEWHMDKCKADHTNRFYTTKEDILTSHFIKLPPMPAKKHILSCHETNLFPLKRDNESPYKDQTLPYDLIQYVSEFQRAWHSFEHPYVIIPPIVEKIEWSNPKNNTAGIIGSIDEHKQTHKAIKMALDDGFKKVLLYGRINDLQYFNQEIASYDREVVEICNHENNKQIMYGSVEAVYHASKRETFGLVEAECKAAGIPYRGVENNPEILTDEEILERWNQILR